MTTVLALDVATKTGYAVLRRHDEEGDRIELAEHGLLRLPQPVKDYGTYPWSYIAATQAMAREVTDLVARVQPDVVVVEETNLGRQRYTQKLLEFLHNALLTRLAAYPEAQGMMTPPVFYVSTSEWRKALGLRLSKDDKKNNRRLSAAKKVAAMTGAKVDKKELGVKGKKTWKHLSVEYVNGRFALGLKQGQNDVSDAVCLGLGFIQGALACTGDE